MTRIAALLGLALVTGCISHPKGQSVIARHRFKKERHTVHAQVLPDRTFKATTVPFSISGTVHGPDSNGLHSAGISIRSVWNHQEYGMQTNTMNIDSLTLYPNSEVVIEKMFIGKERHFYGIKIEITK